MAKNRFPLISDFLLIFSLFFQSNAPAFVYRFWLSPQYLALTLVLWVLLSAVIIWKLNQYGLIPGFLDGLKKSWFLFPFLIFAGISIGWSVAWQVSLYRWLIFLFTFIAGGYIGLKYDLKKIIDLLSVFGIFVLLVAAVMVFFVPGIGVQNYYIIQGAWKGLYWHKNHMGLIASFLNILFLVEIIYSLQAKETQKPFLLWVPFYLFSLFFVIRSDSVAALVATMFLHGIIIAGLLWLKFGGSIRRSHILMFAAFLLFSSTLLFSNLDFVFSQFNRNTTLTGRIPMWKYLFDVFLARRPLGGYGFNAFWYENTHNVLVQQAAGYPDPIVIADNGFIDILVNTGFIGLGLFLIFYLGVWWRSIVYVKIAKNILGIFPILFMSYTLVANISWSLLFENESFFMLVMISILFLVTRSFKESPQVN